MYTVILTIVILFLFIALVIAIIVLCKHRIEDVYNQIIFNLSGKDEEKEYIERLGNNIDLLVKEVNRANRQLKDIIHGSDSEKQNAIEKEKLLILIRQLVDDDAIDNIVKLNK